MSPLAPNHNLNQNKYLSKAQRVAYKPAYKEPPKTVQNQDHDLANVVERWPNLPEHIKLAINALIQTNIQEDTK